ncbi:unnamed protein product [Calicophoron daubneyi]|uniref:39S ribosomal protein L35, mitochondrial n=1 Tax=Calicophoron daubneyi TaxID=300641 RepID=A0AAV2TYG8_CALDB
METLIRCFNKSNLLMGSPLRTLSLFPLENRINSRLGFFVKSLGFDTFGQSGGFCPPRRFIRSREVKHYYAADGEYNPPVQEVIDRFKRLRWGAYIHPRSGRHRHLYRRSEAARAKLGEHILTNRATSFLLDNLVNAEWRRPKYYPEDIYEPYHKRTGVPWGYALRKPKFFP